MPILRGFPPSNNISHSINVFSNARDNIFTLQQLPPGLTGGIWRNIRSCSSLFYSNLRDECKELIAAGLTARIVTVHGDVSYPYPREKKSDWYLVMSKELDDASKPLGESSFVYF